MKTFEYRGFDHQGRAKRGLIEAMDPKAAREQLSAQGILAERVQASDTPATITRHRKPASDETRAAFYRELAALLGSGMPATHALELLISAPEWGSLHGALAALHDRVRNGASLADGLSAAMPGVDAFEIASMASGEQSGCLPLVTGQLADYLENRHLQRQRLLSAALYPAVVLTAAVAVALLMFGVMLPRFARLFEEARIELPAITRVMLETGPWLLGMLVGAPLLAAIALAWWKRTAAVNPALRVQWDRRLFRVPITGKGYRMLAGARFARTLALLLNGGVPLVEAIDLAGRATGSPWLREETQQTTEAVRHGSTLADALRAIPPLAPLAGWVQAGEGSGDLAGMIEQAAKQQDAGWDRYITRTVQLAEPLLVLLAGGLVLLLAIAILLPVLSLNQSIM